MPRKRKPDADALQRRLNLIKAAYAVLTNLGPTHVQAIDSDHGLVLLALQRHIDSLARHIQTLPDTVRLVQRTRKSKAIPGMAFDEQADALAAQEPVQ